MPDPLLPTISLGPHRVTRLLCGGNPFRGYSHRGHQADRILRDYYTPENAVAALFDAQAAGVNAVVMRADSIIFDIVRRYRQQGGTMHWIAQTGTEQPDPIANVRHCAELGAIAVYLHGSPNDRAWKDGRIEERRYLLEVIHGHGLLAGFASHMPEVHRYVVEKSWPIDFHLACFYNIEKVRRESVLAGGQHVEEPFDDPDRDLMCEFIRSTDRPCLAFKILAAGRKCASPADVRAAFAFAFERIKPTDAVIVGVMQRDRNEIREDAQIVRDLEALRAPPK